MLNPAPFGRWTSKAAPWMPVSITLGSLPVTFCLALAIPGISLVAADTRVNFTHTTGEHSTHDGPTNLSIELLDRSMHEVPFRYRKLRRIGLGWATTAGNYLMGNSLLGLLDAHGQANVDETRQLLIAKFPEVKKQVQVITGFSSEQLDRTAIMGAPFNDNPHVWLVSPKGLATSSGIPNCYLTNWPLSVPNEVIQRENQHFEEEVKAANSSRSVVALVRTTATLIGIAAQYSSTVSRYVQIGLTVGTPRGVHVSYYLQAEVALVLAASDSEVSQYLEELG